MKCKIKKRKPSQASPPDAENAINQDCRGYGRKRKNYTGVIFTGIFIILMAVCVFSPVRSFSENENRMLKNKIDISAENISGGSFDDDMEEYLTDQFALRDIMVTAASDIKRFAGLREINGVYLGRDGYLITRTLNEDISEVRAEKNIKALSDYFEGCGIEAENITVMPVPDAGIVLRSRLPDGAAEFDAEKYMKMLSEGLSGCRLIDLRPVLKELDDGSIQVFYRTDHHWTSDAASAAFEIFSASAHGSRAADTAEPELETFSTSFHGSLYSKVLCTGIGYDTIKGPSEEDIGAVTVSIMGREEAAETKSSCYDFSFLDKKDKYSMFFGGNYGYVRLKTESEKNRRALVIKDSFANAFVPFMTNDFEEIDMIDLRYFTGDACSLIKERGITDILVLYELSNILSDENLTKLSRSD